MRTSLTHSEGWKWAPPGRLNPALAAVDAGANSEHGDEREQAETVEPVNDAEKFVIIDHRHDEHGREATHDPENLHALEAVELGVESGGVDFEDADDGKHQHKGKESPVEVAEGEKAAHTELWDSRRPECLLWVQRESVEIIALSRSGSDPPGVEVRRAEFHEDGGQWWAVQGSNLRPPACKAGALTS